MTDHARRTSGPSHLRSWQGDSSTNRMYGSTPRDALNAEIMQIVLTKHDYKLTNNDTPMEYEISMYLFLIYKVKGNSFLLIRHSPE